MQYTSIFTAVRIFEICIVLIENIDSGNVGAVLTSTRNLCFEQKEFVLLRRAISLKVNYEKVKFSNCAFAITILIMNRHTCKLFENIIKDVQNKGSGEVNTA